MTPELLEVLTSMRAPLTFAEAGVTPGWDSLFVVDQATKRIIRNATRVDCVAGLVWTVEVRGGRSWMREGEFVLLATYETQRKFAEVWETWK